MTSDGWMISTAMEEVHATTVNVQSIIIMGYTARGRAAEIVRSG